MSNPFVTLHFTGGEALHVRPDALQAVFTDASEAGNRTVVQIQGMQNGLIVSETVDEVLRLITTH